jgi:hypothetical protein
VTPHKFVMAGLHPAIDVFVVRVKQDVDARVKGERKRRRLQTAMPGHDGKESNQLSNLNETFILAR